LRRIRQGKSIMKKSPDHLAIVMKTSGISVKRITNRFWLISVGFSLTALLLQFGSNLLGFLALIVSVFLFLETALKCYKRT
ncbi:MAG: hypothetical protein PHQ54_02215, partial [Candidatus Omnitrophica bacterium]|nr:hypothetical protein [Candidatus Omnitrophota bacterium]